MSAESDKYLAAILQELRVMRNQQEELSLAGQSPLPVTHSPVTGAPLQDWAQVVFDVVVPANGQNVITQNVSNSTHFYLQYVTGVASVLPADLTLRVRDDNSDTYMQHNGIFIEWENFIGTAPGGGMATPNAPYSLFGFRRFAARSTISIELINVNVAPQVCQIVFHGVKTYLSPPSA